MSYQDAKSKNFAAYCADGKIKYVEKWIDNPNVDINWNYHTPLRNAVKNSQMAVIELLLQHPKLKTAYQDESRQLSGTIKKIDMKINPFTQAIIDENYDVLDILIASGKFKVDRFEHLDILNQMNNDTMNEYFKKQENIEQMILDNVDKYPNCLPQTAKDIFLF